MELQTERRKLGRPKSATPRRVQAAYRKGDIVIGKKILAITNRIGPTGRQEKCFAFRCDCGKRFSTTQTATTQAKNGHALLRCKPCQDKAETVPQLPRYRHIAALNEIPELLDSTKKLIAKMAKKPEMTGRVKERVKSYLEACLANGSPLENLDRVSRCRLRLRQRGLRPSNLKRLAIQARGGQKKTAGKG